MAKTSKVDEARTQLAAAEAAVGLAMSQWQEAQTNVRVGATGFSYTKIFAPCDGRVTRKAVEPGDYVQIGQQLMSLVPTDVWVVANFKESQLRKMKPGQPVSVEIDALGGRTFRAHVDSVQAGSGAAFSLLPPENATGNYVKVVQRVPVKILFDEPLPADHTFGPGLSVTPSVRVSRFEIPAWAIALLAAGPGHHGEYSFFDCREAESEMNAAPASQYFFHARRRSSSGMASAPQPVARRDGRDAGDIHAGAGHVHRQHRAAAHRRQPVGDHRPGDVGVDQLSRLERHHPADDRLAGKSFRPETRVHLPASGCSRSRRCCAAWR